jgi:lysophospholipase L1-like esterase
LLVWVVAGGLVLVVAAAGSVVAVPRAMAALSRAARLAGGAVTVPSPSKPATYSTVPPGALPPMPVISRDAPAFASASIQPPGDASSGDYTRTWRSTGPLPVWLAYDLSGVPKAHRGKVVVAWYEDGSYDYDTSTDGAYNEPRDYTIEGGRGPGGGAGVPADGWVTLVTVSGSTFHSRQHLLDMSGFNWIRIYVTAVNAMPQNRDVAIKMDVHDASAGIGDDWIFYGDSITAGAMIEYPKVGVGTFAQLVNQSRPAYFPVQENGGYGGLTSFDGAKRVPAWLTIFPGHFVALAYGTNDAGYCVDPAKFDTNMAAMIQAVQASGKVAVVPKIPWARTAQVQRCGPSLNARIDKLYAAYPGVVMGPDFWAFFSAHPDLISTDNLHPSLAGFGEFRRLWADQMLATVYPRA